MLTVDFQAMLSMENCPDCHGNKLRKESLHMFITIPQTKKTKQLFDAPAKDHNYYEHIIDKQNPDLFMYNIAQLHTMPIQALIDFLQALQKHSSQPEILLDRILKPLLDRAKTIKHL